MVIPEPMPEELALGYLLRIQAINGHSKPTDTLSALKHRIKLYRCSHGDLRMDLTSILAEASGIPLAKFCYKHTLIPFHCAFQRSGRFWNKKRVTYPMRRSIISATSLKHKTYYCPICVDDDINKYGVPYLRRIHHIPGVTFCPQHDVHLNTLSDRINPIKSLMDSELLCTPADHQVSSNALVRRYIDNACYLLMHAYSMNDDNFFQILNDRSFILGLQFASRDDALFISDIAFELLPKQWLIALHPAYATKKLGVSLSISDYYFILRDLTHLVTLTITLLFDSFDEVSRALDHNDAALRSKNEAISTCRTRLLSDALYLSQRRDHIKQVSYNKWRWPSLR